MAKKLANVVADFTTQLITQIDPGGTSATLKSATDSDGNLMPDGIYFFTLDGSNSQKEHVICTKTGTALTNISTVSRQGIEASAVLRTHRVGCVVTMTDWAQLFFLTALLSGAQGLDSASPLFYDGTALINSANQLATVQYVLSVVNGGAVSFNELVVAGTAGETFSAGQPVYLKASDSRWYKLLANDPMLQSVQDIQIGIAIGSGSSGAAIAGGVALYGVVATLSGLTANSLYYVSDTGVLSTTPGTYSISIGWATSTTVLLLNPKDVNIPTPFEKAALSGSRGIPKSTNLFVTQDNITAASLDQSQATQNALVEFGVANATTLKNKVAQSFIPTRTKISAVRLYKSADSGTFTGTVTIALQADTSGSPSGTNLASVTISNSAWLLLAAGELNAIFGTEYASLVAGNLYWIVLSASTSDTTNHPNLGTNTAGGYANGSAKFNNTTDGWVAIATIDLYFKTVEGVVSQIVQTGTDGLISPSLVSQSLVAIDMSQKAAASSGVYTIPIAANTLGTNRAIKYRILVSSISGLSTDSWTIAVTYGGTSVGSVTYAPGSTSSGAPVFVEGIIAANASAGAQKAMLNVIAAVASGQASSIFGVYASSSVDSTVPQNLVVTLSRASNGNITTEGVIVSYA